MRNALSVVTLATVKGMRYRTCSSLSPLSWINISRRKRNSIKKKKLIGKYNKHWKTLRKVQGASDETLGNFQFHVGQNSSNSLCEWTTNRGYRLRESIIQTTVPRWTRATKVRSSKDREDAQTRHHRTRNIQMDCPCCVRTKEVWFIRLLFQLSPSKCRHRKQFITDYLNGRNHGLAQNH